MLPLRNYVLFSHPATRIPYGARLMAHGHPSTPHSNKKTRLMHRISMRRTKLSWRRAYSPQGAGWPQVPSLLAGLTAVFGMGTGVAPPLQAPRQCRPSDWLIVGGGFLILQLVPINFFDGNPHADFKTNNHELRTKYQTVICTEQPFWEDVHTVNRSRLLSGRPRHRAISTSRLKRSRAVHLWPINLLVSEGPQMNPNLGDGFTLICFQRLS